MDIPTNSYAKSIVYSQCGGTTGNMHCSMKTLTGYSTSANIITNTSYWETISSGNLIYNTDNEYFSQLNLPYVYLIILNSTPFSGPSITKITLKNINTFSTSSFNVTSQYPVSNNNIFQIGVVPLTYPTTNITTKQQITGGGNYYTINQGTYSISYKDSNDSTFTVNNTITFGNVNNPTTSPTQTITIN